MPSILLVDPTERPGHLALITCGATEGRYPREFAAFTAEVDQDFRDGLMGALRLLALHSRDGEAEYKIGDIVSFADPPEPLGAHTLYAGLCITGTLLDTDPSEFVADGIGAVPILSAIPVYAQEILGESSQTLWRRLLASGHSASIQKTRKLATIEAVH